MRSFAERRVSMWNASGMLAIVLAFTLTLTLTTALSSCMHEAPPPQLAKLRVVAEPDTTTVYVDDRYVGSARVLATKPKALPPGVKLVTFKAPGYFPHDVRLDLPSGTTTVNMKLRKIPL